VAIEIQKKWKNVVSSSNDCEYSSSAEFFLLHCDIYCFLKAHSTVQIEAFGVRDGSDSLFIYLTTLYCRKDNVIINERKKRGKKAKEICFLEKGEDRVKNVTRKESSLRL
jgi:hypothetical protein